MGYSQNVRLRSANRANANNTWNVNTSGNANNNNASNAYRFAPDCICSDTYGLFIKQVLSGYLYTRSLYLFLRDKQHLVDVEDVHTPDLLLQWGNFMNKSTVIDYDNLYESGIKCKKGVIWKPSVSSFILNQIERTNQLCDELEAGTYKSRAPKPIKITHPKPREGLCISFRDRVYQRSLNDNALYPMITKAFIYDNAACQKGKGTDFARARIKKFLWNYFCNFGPEGYVLHIDIKGYYPSMRHDVVKNKFAKKVPNDIYGMAAKILDTQYSGTVGYNPGSQMVQIAGIGVLDDVDHFCKEQLHIKYYLRYMDDTIIIHNDKNTLKNWLEIIGKQLNNLGFEININKTKIYPLCRGFLFLGFTFRLTETGKVVLSIDGQNVKAEKRKLKRLVNKVRKGTLTKAKVYDCYNAWKAHASVGNSNKLIQRMDIYFKNLWR